VELLRKAELRAALASSEVDSLFLDPLLEKDQVGDVTIDLRLGYDFHVSILTRNPSIELVSIQATKRRSIGTYFQETRRDLGDTFVLYPHQVVIATTLEYLSLPTNVYADILSRSSYTRLGIHVATMIQPGFRGCVPLELFNHGNSAVELIIGSRLCQARFFKSSTGGSYLPTSGTRKYFGEVRPTISRADQDKELRQLINVRDFDL